MLLFYILLVDFTFFNLSISFFIAQKLFSRPAIVSKDLILDFNSSKYTAIYFCHSADKEILCQAPPHTPWRGMLEKLSLTKHNRKLVDARIRHFALKTSLCNLVEIDYEWEETTKFVMKCAGLKESELSKYSLPASKRLAQAIPLESEYHAAAGNPSEREDVPRCVVPTEEQMSFLSQEIHQDSNIVETRHEMELVSSQFCLSPESLGSGRLNELVQRLHSMSLKLRKGVAHKQKKEITKTKNKASASSFSSISECMEAIYQLAHLWCQRLCCQGFTSGRKSSSWSEAINARIRADVVPKQGFLRNQYLLPAFVEDFDRWVDRLCNVSFIKSKETFCECSPCVLQGYQQSWLAQYLSSYAVATILDRALEGFQKFTSKGGKELQKPGVSEEIRTKVRSICSIYNIDENGDEVNILCYLRLKTLLVVVALAQPVLQPNLKMPTVKFSMKRQKLSILQLIMLLQFIIAMLVIARFRFMVRLPKNLFSIAPAKNRHQVACPVSMNYVGFWIVNQGACLIFYSFATLCSSGATIMIQMRWFLLLSDQHVLLWKNHYLHRLIIYRGSVKCLKLIE